MVRFPIYSNMKVLILIDAKNFEQGVINASKRRNEFRFIDFHKVKNFVLEYLKNNPQYENIQLSLLRNYLYTDKTVDYNTERKVLSVRENRTKCIIIIGFLYREF